jgi:tyrosinase
MMAMSSPNDPVFWLHHCNIDRLWAEWQTENPGRMYLPPSGTPGVVAGHGLDDPMPPWNNETSPPTPRSVLNHHTLDYSYDNEAPTTPENVQLTIDEAPISASIGRPGEVDIFTFEVTSPGSYVVETQGTTDVVMGLYGPNDEDMFITEDDDGGAGQNSRIARDLSSGTYYVRLRHYSSSSTGNYSISVSGSGTQPNIPTIEVNGPAINGAITAGNQRNTYAFTSASPGSFTIETAGSTDCFVTLHGPDNPNTLLAQDDDSGPGTNSRIVADLGPGAYFVQVRHYSPEGTGAYSITVKG